MAARRFFAELSAIIGTLLKACGLIALTLLLYLATAAAEPQNLQKG